MDLITHRLTPIHTYLAFGVYQTLVTRGGPLGLTVLYLQYANNEASPKAISERTSYLQVRLAFHPYPQVIPRLFNVSGFGPPLALTPASTCSWIDHFVSGLQHLT